MGSTYTSLHFHLVFSTKNRQKTISSAFQPNLWAYIAGICKNEGIFVHVIGGTDDHVHLLIQVPPTLALSKGILAIKANSSRWAHGQGEKLAWQQGYAAFSVSASLVPVVARYIQNQKEHHKRMSFQEELLALLKKHGVSFDPRYVWG